MIEPSIHNSCKETMMRGLGREVKNKRPSLSKELSAWPRTYNRKVKVYIDAHKNQVKGYLDNREEVGDENTV